MGYRDRRLSVGRGVRDATCLISKDRCGYGELFSSAVAADPALRRAQVAAIG